MLGRTSITLQLTAAITKLADTYYNLQNCSEANGNRTSLAKACLLAARKRFALLARENGSSVGQNSILGRTDIRIALMGNTRSGTLADATNGDATPSLHDFAARLAKHGEAFMQMFDEPPESSASSVRAPKRNKVQAHAVPLSPPAVAQVDDVPLPAAPADALAGIWSDGKPARKRPREVSSLAGSSPPQPPPPSAPSSKAERRRFMSGKASDVHRSATPQQQPQKQRRQSQQLSGSGLSRDDFLNMQREVQTFGAEALDRKQRKQFDAWQLQTMKATPQKPGRVSAAIGKGIAKKQAERQQKAKEEAIASGMLTAKGSGKHKRQGSMDKGLLEDGGLFKAGMLRVKNTALGKSTSSKRKGPASQRRAFSSGKIGNLDGNSQKAWNVSTTQQQRKKPSVKKNRK